LIGWLRRSSTSVCRFATRPAVQPTRHTNPRPHPTKPQQSKAFAAPGGALSEARQLREELFAARRERALCEGREADMRREVAALRRQVGGRVGG
jgi:hypothetical protein